MHGRQEPGWIAEALRQVVTVLPWFHPNRPMSLLAKTLWGFWLRAFEGRFSAPGMLARPWHVLR
jgi:hypothetical protein